jgi:hypothetical protein
VSDHNAYPMVRLKMSRNRRVDYCDPRAYSEAMFLLWNSSMTSWMISISENRQAEDYSIHLESIILPLIPPNNALDFTLL